MEIQKRTGKKERKRGKNYRIKKDRNKKKIENPRRALLAI